MSDNLAQLAALACPEGGWGYAPGQPAHLEPTFLALLALAGRPQEHAAVLQAAQSWLGQCATGDGTYRLARGRHEAAWPTALALFTLAELGAPADALTATARALLALRGRPLDTGSEDFSDIDGSLVGW